MNIYKYTGAIMGLVGFGLILYGTGGHAQYVPQTDSLWIPPPGLGLAIFVGLGCAVLASVVMLATPGRLYPTGLFFIFCGSFALVMGAVIGLNESLDHSKPVVRTLQVNNLDSRQDSQGLTQYYAMIPSWWDRTRYIPLAITEELYRQITPRETYLDVSVRRGAFGYPYFSDVAISKDSGRPPGMLDYEQIR